MRIYRALQTILALFIAFNPAVMAEDFELRAQRNSQQFYQALLESTVPVGAALYVDGAGERFDGAAGFALENPLIPWSPDMPFYTGSIGKTFIAVAVLQLWQDELLDLDAPLTQYIEPEISDNLIGSERMTIRQLLNHTSGMVDVLDDIPDLVQSIIADPDRPWTDEESVVFAYGLPPHFEPGSQLRYSNTGYMVLAMIAQRVSGEHVSATIRRRILNPLNMTHTYYQVYEGDGSTLVHGYSLEQGGLVDNHRYIKNLAFGAGAIATTASDLGLFYRAIFKNKRLLNKKARHEMLRNNFNSLTPLESVGLGIAKSDWGNIKSFWHNGAIPGYHSMVRYFPKLDLVIVGFFNFSIDEDIPIQPAELFNNTVLSITMSRVSARQNR